MLELDKLTLRLMEMIDPYLTVGFLRFFGLPSLQIQMSKMLTTTPQSAGYTVEQFYVFVRVVLVVGLVVVSFQFSVLSDAVPNVNNKNN